MPSSKRLPIMHHPHAVASLEYSEEYAIIHIQELHYFTKSTFQFMKWYVQELKEFVQTAGYDELYAALPCENKTVAKLAGRLGFNKISEADGMSVYKLGDE